MIPDEKAREIMLAAWDACCDNTQGGNVNVCNCDPDAIAGCEARVKAIAAALSAARREAIEEAAKVADARNLSIMSMTTADITAIEIAASIRALKDKQP